jgi:hypothetical protein
MEAVKERRDKCPKIIIYVNSITMSETLYIWFHSEPKLLTHVCYPTDS